MICVSFLTSPERAALKGAGGLVEKLVRIVNKKGVIHMEA
jgi:hypothetical protein